MRQPVPSSSIKIVWLTGILKEYENPSLFVMYPLSLEIFRTTSLSIQTTVLGFRSHERHRRLCEDPWILFFGTSLRGNVRLDDSRAFGDDHGRCTQVEIC